MNQEKFMNDLLKTWEFASCKPSSTPGVKGSSVSLEVMNPEEIDPKDAHQAQKLAGSLIWLSTRTRPDIAYAQSRISSLATKNPILALEEGKRVLIYLFGTETIGLVFKKSQDLNVVAYGDANYDIKRSQSGIIIKVGGNIIA